MTAPAGWYPEPGTTARERYWDGEQWTSQTRTVRHKGRWVVAAVLAALVVAGVLIVVITSRNSAVESTCNAACHRAEQANNPSLPTVEAGDPSSVAEDPAVPSGQVVYYLTGRAADGADITYTLGGSGASEQQSGITVPMMNKTSGKPGMRFTADPGDFLYFSAQNDGDGYLTCKIVEDGQVIDQERSDGAYTIVTCQGTA